MKGANILNGNGRKRGIIQGDSYRLHTIYLALFFLEFLVLLLGPPFYFPISLSALKCLRNPEAANLLPIPASSVCEKRKCSPFAGKRKRTRQIRIGENNFKWRTQNAGNQTQNVSGKGNRRLHTQAQAAARTHAHEGI